MLQLENQPPMQNFRKTAKMTKKIFRRRRVKLIAQKHHYSMRLY